MPYKKGEKLLPANKQVGKMEKRMNLLRKIFAVPSLTDEKEYHSL